MTQESRLYLEGTLRQSRKNCPNRSRWLVRSERIWHPTGAEEITGDILLGRAHRAARVALRRPGAVLRLRPSLPHDSGNPGGFNYAAYLARAGDLRHRLSRQRQGSRTGGAPNRARCAISSNPCAGEIRRFIERNFSHGKRRFDQGAGRRRHGRDPKETRNDFTAAGVNHVLSISGLHVGMLGLVVFAADALRLGRSAPFCCCAGICSRSRPSVLSWPWCFTRPWRARMVPTVRSAIMIGVYELAVLLDREEEVLTSLTFAALLIALVWPGVITDISFQLSFLAVLFIAWGMRKMHEWFPRSARATNCRRRKAGSKSASAGRLCISRCRLLATLGTGPLIAHYFGHLSLAGFRRQSADRAAGRFRRRAARTADRFLVVDRCRSCGAVAFGLRTTGVPDHLDRPSLRQSTVGQYQRAGAESLRSRAALRFHYLAVSRSGQSICRWCAGRVVR